MTGRLAPLRSAAVLAAGFVVLRVVYRIVFGGADGGGAVLLPLPSIPLGGPFEGTSLLGTVTAGGILAAASSAVPFAALVLGFGVVATVVDIRSLLVRGAVRGPVHTVARALVIAWATLPALAASVRAVRRARELRGERSVASLVVPVLERTVERAIALGASMELRGFASTRPATPTGGVAATLEGVSLGFDDRWILRSLDLAFAPGTLTVVTGATGSGKSTLLASMSGLFQHVAGGRQTGRIAVGGVDRLSVPPRETAGIVAAVPQSVRLSFVAGTVAEEIGFSLAMRSEPAATARGRVERVSDAVGIRHLLDRPVGELSAGEASLVAIAAALAGDPRLLLVDEPLADLDVAARERVVAALSRLAHEQDVCVIVAEHSVDEWEAASDRWIELLDGVAVESADVPRRRSVPNAPAVAASPAVTVAEIRGVTASHGDHLAVDDASFTVHEGDLVALTGPNGAGKSTLLSELALPTRAGTVTVCGAEVAGLSRRDRRAAVALVPEELDDLLFTTSVSVECRRADRARGLGRTAALFLEFVGGRADDPRGLLDRHPRDLSAGERLCLVLAIQSSAEPDLLLVDEPSRGLDADARRMVGDALTAAAARGTAVIIATHDSDFAERYSTRTIRIADGRIVSALGVS